MSEHDNHTTNASGKPKPRKVIRLDDLDWQDDVVGGASGKVVFGESPEDTTPFDDIFRKGSNERPNPRKR
jgi:hypothetical protein